MAQEIYLTITGITGESQKSGVTGWMEIYSFSHGVSNPTGVSHGTGSGTGKAEFMQLSVTKSVDLASPALFAYSASGQHSAKATLIVRESTGGSTTQTYYQYDMTEVFIDNVSWSGSQAGSGKPLETVSMSAKTHQLTYTQQNADGSLGSPVIKGWDVSANQAM